LGGHAKVRAILLRWLNNRRRKREALDAAAEGWIARHGPHARDFASDRSMDAYLLGDFSEQEKWSEVRELIDEKQPGTTRGGELPT
jgi:hypothetical protein